MIRITAIRRNQAFQALSTATDAISKCRTADCQEWRHFWRDTARDSIMAARLLRLHRIEYPSIP